MNLIFFRLIEVTETASMRVAHCFNFAVVTSINRENIIFSSYHLIFILFQRRNILALINAGLFPTFDSVEIQMTSQYSFSVDAKSPQ